MLLTRNHFVSRIFVSPLRLNHPLPLPLRRRSLVMNAAADVDPPAPPSTKTVRVVVKGRVQGVFFRDWTIQNARELGLNGWVRNRRDGTVEALFSGDPAAIDEMVEKRCRVGPPTAAVTALNSFLSNDVPAQGFDRKPTL